MASLSASAAPFKNCANTSGPNANDNTAPPTAEEDEKLRRLDYFNHPYEPGNEIRLIDDIDMDKPLSCISLASQFAAVEDTKRGKKNAVQRKDASKESYSNGELDFYEDLEFEPFDDKKIVNY